MLFSLRGVNQVFALSVLVLSFLLFQNLFGTFIASIGVLLIGFNPLFMTYANRAMTDMMYLFFLIVGLILVRISQVGKDRHQGILALAIGVCTGLAIMTKPFGIMILGVWIISLFFKQINIKKKLLLIIISLFAIIETVIVILSAFFTKSVVCNRLD